MDEEPTKDDKSVKNEDKYQNRKQDNDIITKRLDRITESFIKSIADIFRINSKKELWLESIETLNYDPYFEASNIYQIADKCIKEKNTEKLEKAFKKLSSGHKIILLTITKIIERTVEKTCIVLDEPETHLHPPLLSAFIRTLSNILIKKNGIAIIATHSPVILQEIPQSCSWKMQRFGKEIKIEKVSEKTFGANINSIMREIFGLEVSKTGFHNILATKLKENNYDLECVKKLFNHQLGDEAEAMLRILSVLHKEDGLNEKNE